MKFLDPRAIKDWIKSRAVNSMMATEKGFFMDARQGPVIREELDDIQTGLNEINSKLAGFIITKSFVSSVTVPANSVVLESFDWEPPSGYSVIGVTLSDGGQSVISQMMSLTTCSKKTLNFSSSSVNIKVSARVIFLKN